MAQDQVYDFMVKNPCKWFRSVEVSKKIGEGKRPTCIALEKLSRFKFLDTKYEMYPTESGIRNIKFYRLKNDQRYKENTE